MFHFVLSLFFIRNIRENFVFVVPELVVGFGEQDSKEKRILAIVELRG